MMLRDYQQRDIDRLRGAIRQGFKRILYQLPTGGGKTVLMAFMAHSAANKSKRILFIVHRQELLLQASRTFKVMNVPHGLIAPGHTPTNHAVQIATIQTLINRKIPAPDIIIFDEAHHCRSNTWLKIFSRYPDAVMIGVTATPCRLDGRGLKDVFDILICGPSTSELIARGFLSKYKVFAPPGIDTTGIKMQAGDYNMKELAAAADKPTITGDAVQHYKKLAYGKQAIAFCCSIEHSKHVVAEFVANGISATHIDSKLNRIERQKIISDFQNGKIKVLSNCDLISEGFDVPAVEAVILLRPTASLSLYLQQVGRSLRPADNKSHAIILDHAGNVIRHGLPDDEREWKLETTRKKGKKKDEPNIQIKQCSTCYAVHRPAPQCPQCGTVYEIKGREVDHVDGELQELNLDAIRKQKKQEVGRARTLNDLLEVARQRGYKEAWAHHIFNARQARGAA